jgi:hypothetical protein
LDGFAIAPDAAFIESGAADGPFDAPPLLPPPAFCANADAVNANVNAPINAIFFVLFIEISFFPEACLHRETMQPCFNVVSYYALLVAHCFA